MMHFTTLLTTAFLIPTVTANLYSSGMFLVRISSERRHRIQYCFTELPYTLETHQKGRCLKSGQIDVAKQTEKVIDLRLMNVSTAYLTLEFTVPARGFGPPKQVVERVIVDGALPAKRIAVAGLFINFVTICDRPWYGLMCARYCIEHDDAHYVCDPRGEKVCLVGWTGTDCDIVKEDIFPVSTESTSDSPPPTPPPKNPTPSTSTGRLTTEITGFAKLKTITTTMSSLPNTIKRKKSTATAYTATAPTTAFTTPIAVTNSKTMLPPTQKVAASNKDSSLENYAMRKPSTIEDSRTSSPEEIVLLIILLVIATSLLVYLLIIIARNSTVQNWINSQKAKFFASRCSSRSNDTEEESSPKVFATDINKNTKKLETFDSSEKLGPRYSSQPTLGANKDASTTHDVSVVESNMYHEIDSFLVPPVVDLRIATLV